MNKLNLLLIFLCVFSLSACNTTGKRDTYKGMSAKDIYSKAEENVKKEHFGQAAKDFEALESRFPYSEYSDKAQIGLTHAYYKQNDSALALSTADRFIRMNPQHPHIDYVYYLKGLTYFDQNMTFMYRHLSVDRSARDPSYAQDAFDVFKLLLEKFPKSEYASDAKHHMVYLRDQLARYELQVLEYYMERGAYLSAADRANYIIKNFEKTTVVPKALADLVISYRKLGMTTLANDTLQILRSNYPKEDEVLKLL